MSAEKAVHVHDAATGKVRVRIALNDPIGGVGITLDGSVWILEWHGRLAGYEPVGRSSAS